MKAVDSIYFMLLAWTCVVCGASFMVVFGIPWPQAIAHTLTACVVGVGISMLLLAIVEHVVKRKWPTLLDSDRLEEADAKSEPQ